MPLVLAKTADSFMVRELMEVSEQIGERLRQARTERGLSLDDAAFQSKLPRNILEALEDEDFSSFISPLYARSFLRQYSDFLSVDALPWLDGLQPSEYFNGNPHLSLLDQSNPLPHSRTTEQSLRRGTGSNIFLLIISAAFIYGGVMIYHSFDESYGNYSSEPNNDAQGVAKTTESALPASKKEPPPAAIPIAEPSAEVPAPVQEDEPISQVPPRAIVVE